MREVDSLRDEIMKGRETRRNGALELIKTAICWGDRGTGLAHDYRGSSELKARLLTTRFTKPVNKV